VTLDEARAILIERARRLAQPLQRAEPEHDARVVATFRLAGERYAVEVRFVREIGRLVDLTPIPGAPEHLFGLTNLRGEILAVFDLRRFFGLSRGGLTDLSRIIVLGEERNELGLLADEAHEVVPLREEEILDPPSAGTSRELVRGVTKDALILLDGAAVLRDPRFYVDQIDPIRVEE
jgi:purine-binding chemotaxis protein CheW